MANDMMTDNDWKILARAGITPDRLHVGGWLDLRDTEITALPEGLHVGGSLDLGGTNITALPEGLHVGGGLDLSGTKITALPEGLHVGGWLDLRDTEITALPEGLHVGGSLNLRGTNIPTIHTDSRGYDLHAAKLATGWFYTAGCRTFKSADAALAHWGSDDYPNKDRGKGFCDAIRKHMESVK